MIEENDSFYDINEQPELQQNDEQQKTHISEPQDPKTSDDNFFIIPILTEENDTFYDIKEQLELQLNNEQQKIFISEPLARLYGIQDKNTSDENSQNPLLIVSSFKDSFYYLASGPTKDIKDQQAPDVLTCTGSQTLKFIVGRGIFIFYEGAKIMKIDAGNDISQNNKTLFQNSQFIAENCFEFINGNHQRLSFQTGEKLQLLKNIMLNQRKNVQLQYKKLFNKQLIRKHYNYKAYSKNTLQDQLYNSLLEESK